MNIFVVQYAHPRDGFDGWHNIAAFADESTAQECLQREETAYPGFRYQMRPLKYIESSAACPEVQHDA